MRSVNKAALLAVLIFAQNGGAYAISFQNKDWELVCDNTRTCRAVSRSGNSSMLLARKAGQHTPVIMEFEALQLKEGDSYLQPLNKTGMQIGDISVSDFDSYIANQENLKNLLNVMPDSEYMVFSGDGYRWKMSLAGLKAVLLKMDEVQGRVGRRAHSLPKELSRKNRFCRQCR